MAVPIIDHSQEAGAGGKALTKKLLKVMESLSWIEKRGENSAQNYKYVQADDVAAEVRKKLVEFGVGLTSSVLSTRTNEYEGNNGKKVRITHVEVAWIFTDTETGHSTTSVVPGEAMDAGDKAIYKAMTGSLKYAMKMNFLIPTGDDPEENSASDEIYKETARPSTSSRTSSARASSDGAGTPKAPGKNASNSGGLVPFGKHKGKNWTDETIPLADLEWLKERFEESVNKKDPKWHESNVAQLKAVTAALNIRQAQEELEEPGEDEPQGDDAKIPF